MITLIEALNFRCLRDVQLPLQGFQVLVGPNATGKSTFLDVVAFLGRLVADGPEAAVADFTENPRDLLWGREGSQFQLAIEAEIPAPLRASAPNADDTVRYEVSIDVEHEVAIHHERLTLKRRNSFGPEQIEVFPREIYGRESLVEKPTRGRVSRTVVKKTFGGLDRFVSEVDGGTDKRKPGKYWINTYRLGSRRSSLGNLPEDETKYPVATWVKSLLADGIQRFVLNSALIKRASPPTKSRGFKPDGSNLPWVVYELERSRKKEHREKLRNWIEHLRTALPDLVGLRTVERRDDRHRYVVLKYASGLEIPSWLASDGTLRLLALTLPAYAGLSGIYLIEEPENGIHPRAVQTVYQSLSSMYDAQVLSASHSPVVLGLAEPKDILCFAKDKSGATDIVRGSEHPALKLWKREASLGELFAGGVLG